MAACLKDEFREDEKYTNLMSRPKCVSGVSIHDRGFGFVQFESEEEAKKAVQSENGSLLKANRIGKFCKT